MTDLKKFLAQNSIKFVNFRFTDLVGKVHSITYNVDKVAEPISKISFQEGIELIPDVKTIFNDPFCAQPTAVILCDASTGNDSRSVAKRACNYMLSTKIADEVQFGFEVEFSIFDDMLSILEEKHDRQSDSQIDSLSDLRSEILLMMIESGIESPLYHKQISPSQGLVRVSNNDFLINADSIQKSKYIIYNVAHSYGKVATFLLSNSLYLYQLLLKNNESLFKNTKSYSYYIGGIVKHINAINAFSNSITEPSVVPVSSTGIQKSNTWIPASCAGMTQIDFSLQNGEIKLSSIDPLANPYLYFAAILMAGLDGIQNKIDPNGIEKQAASSLNEALEALNKDREFLLKGEVFTNEQLDEYINKA